jgi:hypothetical protein
MTFELQVDKSALHDALVTLGAEIDKELFEESRVTANNIDRESSARLQRQLGPGSTGKTVAGIHVVPLGSVGHAVVSERNPFPNLPLWLDKGTHSGGTREKSHRAGGVRTGGSVHMAARPYFDVSVKLEEAAHLRRVDEAVQRAINAKGLGD